MSKLYRNGATGEVKAYREWQRAVPPKALQAMLKEGVIALVDEEQELEAAAEEAAADEGVRQAKREMRLEARRLERAGRLTALQSLAAFGVWRQSGGVLGVTAAQVAAEGMTVFAASGALSSLVEKGVLRTQRVKGGVVYFVTDAWADRVRVLAWRS